MLKKTITYKNYDEQTITEEYCFSLNESEISELEFSKKGGLSAYIQEISATEDATAIAPLFKDIILRSVGVRDGKMLRKNEQVRTDFVDSGAYNALFMELIQDADKASDFMIKILPTEMQAQASGKIAN